MKFASIAFFLSFALLCPYQATAADVWECEDVKSTGFYWSGSAWEDSTFNSEVRTIVIDGENSRYSAQGYRFPYQCRDLSGGSIRCDDSTGGTILIDPATGRGALSELLGATKTGLRRDTVSVLLLRCSRP